MRKLSILFLILTTMFVGCEKKSNDNPSIPSKSGYVFTSAPAPIVDLILNPLDPLDERFNKALYEFAGGLKKSLEVSNEYNSLVAIANAGNSEIAIDSLISINIQIKSTIESFMKRNDNSKNYDFYKNELQSIDNNCKPIIFIPNLENCDFNLKPIIAIGTEIITTNPQYEDFIPGWKINNDLSTTEIIIGESERNAVINPILILTTSGYAPNLKSLPEKSSLFISNTLYNAFITKYQIMHRYETSNWSEYMCGQEFIMSNGLLLDQGGSLSFRFKIKDIHKNDVGTLFSGQNIDFKNLAEIASTPEVSYASFFVTYEYDWYAGKKDVLVTASNTGYSISQAIVKCRMKKGNEWYQRGYHRDVMSTTPPTVEVNDKEGIIKVEHSL